MIINRSQSFIYVCNIRTPYVDANGVACEKYGTGIFITKDNKYYLLTAQHISSPTNSQSYIYLCDNQQNPVKILLTTLNPQLKWIDHKIADMAVLEIDSQINGWISTRAFPYSNCDIGRKFLNRDVELTTVGFPLSLGVNGKFSPLTFRSFASSDIMLVNRFDTKTPSDFFFLENPSIGGYSGGPVFDLGYIVSAVFTQKKDETRLIGIMHGVVQTMACVTPISYLKDII